MKIRIAIRKKICKNLVRIRFVFQHFVVSSEGGVNSLSKKLVRAQVHENLLFNLFKQSAKF